MSDILNYEFNINSIEFLMMNDVVVNAAQMSAIYHTQPEDFLKTKGANDLIAALKKKNLGQKRNISSEKLSDEIAAFNAEDII